MNDLALKPLKIYAKKSQICLKHQLKFTMLTPLILPSWLAQHQNLKMITILTLTLQRKYIRETPGVKNNPRFHEHAKKWILSNVLSEKTCKK